MAKTRRFKQITLEDLNPEARKVGEQIMAFSAVGLGGPYNVMFRSPVMAERLKKLLDYLRFEGSLPLRLNEFAILIQARLWSSQVEWFAHYPLAVKAGLPASVADELKQNKRPSGMQEDEAFVYDFCMALSTEHWVSDELFEKGRKLLGEQQLVDLIAVSGTYVTVAMMLNAGQESVPQGKALPFPEAA